MISCKALCMASMPKASCFRFTIIQNPWCHACRVAQSSADQYIRNLWLCQSMIWPVCNACNGKENLSTGKGLDCICWCRAAFAIATYKRNTCCYLVNASNREAQYKLCQPMHLLARCNLLFGGWGWSSITKNAQYLKPLPSMYLGSHDGLVTVPIKPKTCNI